MKKLILYIGIILIIKNFYINSYEFKKNSESKLKDFYLALSGIVMESNHSNHTDLRPYLNDKDGEKDAKEIINSDWGIIDHKTSIEAIENLLNNGHSAKAEILLDYAKRYNLNNNMINTANLSDIDKRRLSFIYQFIQYFNEKEMLYAWDYGRVVSVSRWSYQAGYLTEEETWDYIIKAGNKLLSIFNSWEDYGANYTLGRLYWKASFDDYRQLEYQTAILYYTLLDEKIGIWKKVPWPRSKTSKKSYSYIDKYKNMAKFYIAIRKNDINSIKELIGSDKEYYNDSVNEHEWPPVYTSVENKSNEVTKLLISSGFDINKANPYNNRTPLMQSILDKNDEITNFLLNENVDINAIDNTKWNALIFSIRYSSPEIAKKLLNVNADINVVDSDGWSVLMFATRYSTPEIIKMILEKKPDLNVKNKNGWDALKFALRNNFSEISKIILLQDPEVNTADNEGWTTLMYAIRYSTPDIIKIILEKNPDINVKNNRDWTVIIFAIRYCTNEITEKLIEIGADLNIKTIDGWTPLHFAASRSNLIIAEKLIKLGLDTDALNNDGKKPYDLIKDEKTKIKWKDLISNKE